MGRKLAFDRDKALQKAMESFWVRGYKETSMRRLADRLELHLGSVYNALGPKEAVFEAALHRYFDLYIAPRLKQLRADPHPLAAIESYFEYVVNECCAKTGDSAGCFFVNSLHEISRINPDITTYVHQCVEEQESAFIDTIRRGQEQGVISAEKDPEKLGRCVVATMFSMWVLVRLGMTGERITDLRDCVMAALRPKE